MQVKIAILPLDKDPADIILDDFNQWKDIIKSSVNIISFHINQICSKTDDTRVRGRQIREIIFPFLSVIKSSIDQSAYIDEIHQKTNIPLRAIIEDFERYENEHQQIKNIKDDGEKTQQKPRRQELEKRFFGILFWLEKTKDDTINIKQLCEDFQKEIGRDVYEKMHKTYKENSSDLAFETEVWYGGKIESVAVDIKEITLNLEEEILNESLMYLTNKLNQEKNIDQNQKLESILGEYQKIVGRIENIKYRRCQ